MNPRQTRTAIAALLAILIAGIFWSQSRIPALNEKAQMGLRTNFGDIAFEVVLPVVDEQALPERVFRGAVNWGYTNLRGMLFGLLFAAAMLSILANLRSRRFRRPWMNTLGGMFLGAPLGVCVNCATPIALGIYSAGARLETALASLVASPTLNVIVLTMAFTLLPWELAAAKLVGVAIVLLLIPLIVRRFAAGVDIGAANAFSADSTPRLPPMQYAEDIPEAESFPDSILQTTLQYFRSLWYLVRFAVPLMVAAGFLGALVIEVVPFEWFADTEAGPVGIIVAALVAVILPVPIAFDVIIVMALLASGVDTGIAAAMLFGLGIFSIYPAAVLARYVSVKLSVALAITVGTIAVLMGISADSWFERKIAVERNVIASGLEVHGDAVYQDAMNVCNELPASLHGSCLANVVEKSGLNRSVESYCQARPLSVSKMECQDIVRNRLLTTSAIDQATTEPCDRIANMADRSRCEISAVLKSAQNAHDIGQCSILADPRAVYACRTEYINASLLFNPDNSACAALPEEERSLCEVNAAIYRYADSGDFSGCDSLVAPEARGHCQYTIASNLLGRFRDASSCGRIESPALSARCRTLADAWHAEDQRSFELCRQLAEPDLQNLCLTRVADIKIAAVFSDSMLAKTRLPHDDLPPSSVVEPNPAETPGAPELTWESLGTVADVSITGAAYPGRTNAQTGRFRMVPAGSMGITESWNFAVSDFFEPFIIGKGIASGDFNGDGWPDLALATERGVRIYRNTGGAFSPVVHDQAALGSENLFLVAFVDADGDGRADLFASAYGGKNYLLYNGDGEFGKSRLEVLPGSQRLTLAAGFGDLDGNGMLDIVLGNWSSGIEKLFVPSESANSVLLRENDSYRQLEIDSVRGETNSVLIAHLDGDNAPDLFIGNDRLVPDFVYFGSGGSKISPIPTASMRIPRTTMFTMSVDAADFNNDLHPDIFSTDMTFSRSSRDDYCAAITVDSDRSRCYEVLDVYERFREQSAASCTDIENAVDRSQCFAAFAVRAAKQQGDNQYCEVLPRDAVALRSLCRYLAQPPEAEESLDLDRYIEQVQRNTLLLGDGERFVERAVEYGVDSSFWSWNAKAADLDNDGWQDIYVGNGFHFGDNFYEIQENILYRNLQGRAFEQVQEDWLLDDSVNTPSYTYIDFDLDGDLDIIATGVLAPPRVYVNEVADGQSITFQLLDDSKNTAAIGARVTVTYGDSRAPLVQRKEIKLSGGFLSFDNPVLHFGTGGHSEILAATIHWPDGQESVIAGPLKSGHFYRLQRTSQKRINP